VLALSIKSPSKNLEVHFSKFQKTLLFIKLLHTSHPAATTPWFPMNLEPSASTRIYAGATSMCKDLGQWWIALVKGRRSGIIKYRP